MSAGDVTGQSTTAPSVYKGAVSLISRKTLSSLPHTCLLVRSGLFDASELFFVVTRSYQSRLREL